MTPCGSTVVLISPKVLPMGLGRKRRSSSPELGKLTSPQSAPQGLILGVVSGKVVVSDVNLSASQAVVDDIIKAGG